MPDRECFINKSNLWLFITSLSWNFSGNKLVPELSLLGLGFLCRLSYKHTMCMHERKREKDRQRESVHVCVTFLSLSNFRAYLTFCSQCSRQTGKTQLKGMKKNEKSLQPLHLRLHPSFPGTKVFLFCLLPLSKFLFSFLLLEQTGRMKWGRYKDLWQPAHKTHFISLMEG